MTKKSEQKFGIFYDGQEMEEAIEQVYPDIVVFYDGLQPIYVWYREEYGCGLVSNQPFKNMAQIRGVLIEKGVDVAEVEQE